MMVAAFPFALPALALLGPIGYLLHKSFKIIGQKIDTFEIKRK
jgi:hypothetical protein